jgi:hypothetical protein
MSAIVTSGVASFSTNLASRGADRIHVADDVRDRDVRRRQFLHEAAIPADPVDR